MSNQDIFDTLSELECVLYYRADGSDDRCGLSYEDTQAIHDKVDELLNLWSEKTGCYLK